jgi:Flp pilus assembly protein TadG
VYPLTLLLMLGILDVGLAVFRQQQLTLLARDGARWASMQGPTYQSDMGVAGPTNDAVKTRVLGKLRAGMVASKLVCRYTPTTATASVELTYPWSPGCGLFRAVTLRARAVEPVTY